MRGKQSIYRRIVSDHRHRSGDQNHQRTDSRTSRATNGSTRHHSSQSSRPQTDDERESGSVSRRSGQSSRRRDQVSGHSQSSYHQSGNSNFVGGSAQTIVEHPVDEDSSNTQPSQSNDKPESHRGSDVASNDASSSRTSTPSQAAKESLSSSKHVSSTGQEQDNQQPAPSPPLPAVPASVKRYSLVDKPASPTPVVVVDPSSPMPDQTRTPSPQPPSETPLVDPPPAVALSLAVLKSNDVILERRASKRFSVYNISKMTGASTSRERSLRGHSNHVNRRSVVASPANLTPNDLAVLTEDDEEAAESPKELTSSSGRRRSRSRSVVRDTEPPQVTGLPTTPEPIHDVEDSSSSQRRLPSSDSSQITVFLQLGREVKKVKIEPGLTFSSLRVLFVDKFSYNPGLENFPAIYIRDPSSGVQYELENMDEVQEKCLLSLNIERTYFFIRIICYNLSFYSSGSN